MGLCASKQNACPIDLLEVANAAFSDVSTPEMPRLVQSIPIDELIASGTKEFDWEAVATVKAAPAA